MSEEEEIIEPKISEVKELILTKTGKIRRSRLSKVDSTAFKKWLNEKNEIESAKNIIQEYKDLTSIELAAPYVGVCIRNIKRSRSETGPEISD